MSGVVEEKEKKRLREELSRDSEQTAYNNFTDGASQGHASKKKKQVETKQVVTKSSSKAKGWIRISSKYCATYRTSSQKLQKATNKDTAGLKQS